MLVIHFYSPPLIPLRVVYPESANRSSIVFYAINTCLISDVSMKVARKSLKYFSYTPFDIPPYPTWKDQGRIMNTASTSPLPFRTPLAHWQKYSFFFSMKRDSKLYYIFRSEVFFLQIKQLFLKTTRDVRNIAASNLEDRTENLVKYRIFIS